jgi:hypothetical protein
LENGVSAVIEVLVNDVTLEGMRYVKVVSDMAPVPYSIPAGSLVQTWPDEQLGLYYLEATWPCREAISIRCEGWPQAREMVLWKLAPGERVSQVLMSMMALYGERFKSFPDYAFMRKLPGKIEHGFEVTDVMFCEAEWVPPGCIAVCKGEHYGCEAMAL